MAKVTINNKDVVEKFGSYSNNTKLDKKMIGVATLYSEKLAKVADKIFTGEASIGAFKWKYPKDTMELLDFNRSALMVKARILGKFPDTDPRILDNIFRNYMP